MNEFDNSLTKSKCLLLLQFCKGGRVPIKVHAAHAPASQPTWTKATMVGVKGDNIIYRPLNFHGRDEEAPIDKCRLWKSRMSAEMIEKVLAAERADQMAKNEVPLVMTPPPTKQTQVVPIAAEQQKPEEMIAHNTPIVSEVRILPTEPSFSEMLEQHRLLTEKIKQEASTRLSQLEEDRSELQVMLTKVDEEIRLIKSAISVPTSQPVHIVKKEENLRGYNLYRKEVVNVLEQLGGWRNVGELKKILEFEGARFSDVYQPLIAEGKLEAQMSEGGKIRVLALRIKPKS